MPMTPTMKAVVMDAPRPPQALQVRDLPIPTLPSGKGVDEGRGVRVDLSHDHYQINHDHHQLPHRRPRSVDERLGTGHSCRLQCAVFRKTDRVAVHPWPSALKAAFTGRPSARYAPDFLVPLSAREGSKSVRCRVGGRDVLDKDDCVVLRTYDAFVVQARRVVGPADGMFML
jgi:hypothetical protein